MTPTAPPTSSQTPHHLLIFTKHPVPGYAKTRLIPSQGPHGAAEISRLLTEHTITTARNLQQLHPSSRTFVHYAKPESVLSSATEAWLRPNPAHEKLMPQIDGNLGDRLISAFNYSFSNSASKVIVIGTDSPQITPHLLQRAFQLLDKVDVVIGPALDGGYYLIGMKQMYTALFQDIPWSTNTVLTDSVAKAFELQLSVDTLEPLRDIDEIDDLLHLPTSQWSDSKSGMFGDP